jgi:short-subunit dehydrogenase
VVDQEGARVIGGSVNRRTALVTGATSGIGYELAKLFVRDGFDLVIVARNDQRLHEVADELRRGGVGITVVAQDLSQPDAADAIYRQLTDAGVDVDVLVNNAGFSVYGPFWTTDPHRQWQMIQTNIVALTQLTHLLLTRMVARRSGRILNLASTASFAPGPYSAVYGASKAYVLSFSEALAEELRGTGVTVTTLCPGPTKTEFAERAHLTGTNLFRGRLSSAADVARVGYRALMRGQTTVVVGLANQLLLLTIRLSPRTLVLKVSRRMMQMGSHRPQAA